MAIGITEAIVAVLNTMLVQDPGATHALIENRVPCNEVLAKHPHVQVAVRDRFVAVGMLGVLNGIAAAEDGLVVAVMDGESHIITHFERRVAP